MNKIRISCHYPANFLRKFLRLGNIARALFTTNTKRSLVKKNGRIPLASPVRSQTQFKALLMKFCWEITRKFIIVFLCCYSLQIQAANTAQMITLSLKDAILLSLRYNPNVHNAEIQRIADRYALAAAYYTFEPQFSVNGQAQHLQSVTNRIKDRTQNTVNLDPQAVLKTSLGTEFTLKLNNPITNSAYRPSATLDVNQPLLRGVRKVVVLQNLYNAIDTEAVNKLRLKDSIINTVNQVIQDYLTLIQDYQTLKVDQKSLDTAIKTVEQNKIRIKAGTMAPTENTRPMAEIPSRKLAIARDINNIQKDKRKLLDDIGLDPSLNINIEQRFDYYPTKLPEVEESLNQGINSNVNYQISRINLNATERNYLKAKDDEHWQLDAFANVKRGGGTGFRTFGNGANHSESVGLKLNVPIGDVNLRNATINAKIQLRQERTNLTEQKRQLFIDIKNNLNDLATQREQIDLAIQNEALQAKTVQEAEKKASYGRTSMFEVSTEQDNLTSSQQQVIDNKIAFLRVYANFDVLLGQTLDRWNISIIY